MARGLISRRARDQEIYYGRIKLGVCTRCGNPIESKEYRQCNKCLRKNKLRLIKNRDNKL